MLKQKWPILLGLPLSIKVVLSISFFNSDIVEKNKSDKISEILDEFDNIMKKLQAKVVEAKTCPNRDNPYFDMCRIIGSPNLVPVTYTFTEFEDRKCDLPPVHLSGIIPGCVLTDLFMKVNNFSSIL